MSARRAIAGQHGRPYTHTAIHPCGPPMDEIEPVDPAALARLKDWGGDRLLHQMIRLFLENSVERMTQIHDGFAAGVIQDVERGAHSLKSSSGNVGAVEVHRIAEDMEDRTVEGDMEGARELLEPLQAAHARAVSALRDVQGDTST